MNRAQRALLLLVAISLALAVWLRPRAPLSATGLAPGPAREGPAREGEEREPTGARLEPASAGERRTLDADAAAPARALTLFGTLVVVEPSGAVRAHESGSFVLERWERGTLAAREAVVVERGRWSLDTRVDGRLAVSHIELGGRRADLEPGARVHAAAPLALRARWRAPSVLHVRAAESGAELTRVELVRSERGPPVGPDPYDEDAALFHAADSPIELPEPVSFARRATLWARSPGRAWGRMVVDLAGAEERTLALAPAGELAVLLAGWRPPHALLVLEDAAQREVLRVALAEHELVIESLAAGRYEAGLALERGGAPLDARAVEVRAGERALVSFALLEPPEPERVGVAGTLGSASGWERAPSELELHLLRELGSDTLHFEAEPAHRTRLAPVAGRARLYSWRVERVLPGDYLIASADPPGAWDVAVGPEGASDLRLEIAEPADVGVSLVDEESRAPAQVDGQLWSTSWRLEPLPVPRPRREDRARDRRR